MIDLMFLYLFIRWSYKKKNILVTCQRIFVFWFPIKNTLKSLLKDENNVKKKKKKKPPAEIMTKSFHIMFIPKFVKQLSANFCTFCFS